MNKLGSGLALAGALGAAGCENEINQNTSQESVAQNRQNLSAEDILRTASGQPIPWSVEGDGNVNFCELDGQKLMLFTRDPYISLYYVKCDETIRCVEESQVEEVQGLPRGVFYVGGFIYTNANGQAKFAAHMSGDGERSPGEFDVRFNANNQLEVAGDPVQMIPDLPKRDMETYFLQNGTPSVFWDNDMSGTIRNLLTGEDTELNGNLAEDATDCGNPSIDSDTGLVVAGKLRRDARGETCRLQYSATIDGQLSPIVTINTDPQYADKSLVGARSSDGVLVYGASPRRAGFESRHILHYAVPQPQVVPDAGIDAALLADAAADAAQDAAADAARDAEVDAEQDAAVVVVPVPDAGVPPTPDEGVPPTPDQGVPPAADEGVPPTPDQGVPPAPDQGVPPTPDEGVPPTPDQGVPPTPDQGVPPRPDQGVPPNPDEGVPPVNPQHAPYEITLETGNCVQSALKEITVGRAKFTEFEVTGDGTQICKLSLDPDGPKTEAILTISSSDHGRMKVTIQLPYDVAQNVEAEINNNSTDIRTLEDQHGGQHVNINKLGVVTAGAACDFFVDSDEPTSDGHQIFKVASFNKPDEPEIFVKFPDGTFFIPSNGKTYVVDVDTQQVLGLPQIPVCETGDENCSVTPPPGTPPTNVPPGTSPEDGGGSEGCGCSVGGRQLTGNELTSLLVALGLIGVAKPRRKRD